MGSGRSRSGVLSVALSLALPVAALAVTAGLYAQSDGGSPQSPLQALRHGPLVVWYVSASPPPPLSNLDAIAALHNATPLDYTEHSAVNFGQNVSSYGQTAESYGVNADSRSISVPSIPPNADASTATPDGIGYKEEESTSFGQNAGSFGTTAGNVGQESSTLGQTSGSYGQTSGSYGTEPSNVGQDESSFGVGSVASPVASFGQGNGAGSQTGNQPLSAPGAERIKDSLREAFPDLRMQFVVVAPDDLEAKLAAANGTTAYPDALLGTVPSAWWSGMENEFGLTMLRPAVFYPNGMINNPESAVEVAILAHAPHMEAARAFALWMSEPGSDCPGCVQAGLADGDAAAAHVARIAMKRLLNGVPLGEVADPRMAANSSRGERRTLAAMGSAEADADVRVQVEHASTNGSLAAVALRVVVSSHGVFGVEHPLVVLRLSKDKRWRVLQLTLNLPPYEQAEERRALMLSDPPSAAEARGGVKGITPAAPLDGQTVSQMPHLVWDNHGGAGLQVVEWQRGEGDGWSDARLYLVPDDNATLRTQAMARFVSTNGRYRWRVWSVGAHGATTISAWRTFRLEQ